MERPEMPVLDLAYHGLSVAELEEIFDTGSLGYHDGNAKLREIVETLEMTYCGSIGAEYMHIVQADEQMWVQHRLERARSKPPLTAAEKRRILERLTAAEGLEKYLHGRYPGTKRFGLEGAESLIPCVHELLQRLGSHDVLETVVGMAHRGRLNVLVNILGKDPWDLFSEFDGKVDESLASGDVKYHQGFSTNVMTPGGEMHLALAFNPSHLEIVGPVVAGSVRARQDRRRDYGGNLVVPIVVHGDAAFAGQGVVMETLQMSQTRGFKTGGTVHIILNNQIGFTTHRAGRCPLHRVLHRDRQDGAGAHLPRQRRRPGGGDLRHPVGGRLPHVLPQGRGHRPGVLPPPRAQRGRRTDRSYPAVDVPEA